ncbi:MAG: porin family protein [Rhizobiaceae bacterium]|nr:porin family protein [Rhizobiaceae bacterium]
MKTFLKTGLILAGVLGFSHTGLAADLDPTIIRAAETGVEYGSGWYLRGHLGYSKANSGNQVYTGDTVNFNLTRQDSDEQGYSAGLGFGYTFNPYFRMDVTADYYGDRNWTGLSQRLATRAGDTGGERYATDNTAYELTNYSVNGYVSLGRFGGFSPYIGAGVGLADVKWANHVFTGLCVMDVGEGCNGYDAHSSNSGRETTKLALGTLNGASDQVVTYSLIGGFDYRLDKNWLIDFEYKHTNVPGGLSLQHRINNGVTVSSVSEDFSVHDFRVGLRYEIW